MDGKLEYSFKLFEIVTGVSIIFLLLIIMILFSSKAGKESANKFIERCDQKLIIKSIILINSEDKPFEGCTIACNSNQCAYQGESRVVIINNDRTLYGETQ